LSETKKTASGAQSAINEALRAVVSKATERAIAKAAAEIGELCREEVAKALAEALPGAIAAIVSGNRPQPLPFAGGAQQAVQPSPQGAVAESQSAPTAVEIDGKMVPIAVKGAPAGNRKTEVNIATTNKGVPTSRGRVMDGIMPHRGP